VPRRSALPLLLGLVVVLSGPALGTAADIGGAAPAVAAPDRPTPSPTRATGADEGAEQLQSVRVDVTTLLPRAPALADGPFHVAGRLVAGDEAVSDLEVQVTVGPVLRSRSALALADEDPVPGRPRGPVDRLEPGDLPAGGSAGFDLRMPVADLGLTRIGVYPLQVEVRGRVDGARRATTLGTASTFVPWFPDGPTAQNRVAFLWPLIDVPARTPDDALLDESLLASLGEVDGRPGRLAALVGAARDGAVGACDPAPPPPGAAPGDLEAGPAVCRRDPVPLTWAVDPELLETVAALAEEHDLEGPEGPAPAPGAEQARRWLEDLRQAVAGGPARNGAPALPEGAVLALPYADPDVVALTVQRSGLADDVDQLRLLGRRVAAEQVGVEPLDDVAWPPPGPLSSSALDASLGGGATAVVLDESALPPLRFDVARSPGARTALSSPSAGSVTGLVVEAALSRLLTASEEDDDWQGERLAEQRWLVETAMLTAERPGEARTFVVAPRQRAAVVPAVATEVLRDAGRLPWLCPVPLADVVAGTERCPGEPASPGSAPESDVEDRGDLVPVEVGNALSRSYVQALAEVRDRGRQLTDEVLLAGSDDAAEVKARFLRARARAASSAWRDRPQRGQAMLDLYRDDVDAYRGQIKLLTPQRQLLTSDTGVIDVSISNALDQPVTLGVQLNDPVEARLSSADTDLRTVEAQEVAIVRLRAETRTSGQFVVRATLVDRAGQPFGEPSEFLVASTGFGRLALAVTGVGAGVLLVAVGVRLVRRALRREDAVPLGPDE
jgi:hypothetical protein